MYTKAYRICVVKDAETLFETDSIYDSKKAVDLALLLHNKLDADTYVIETATKFTSIESEIVSFGSTGANNG